MRSSCTTVGLPTNARASVRRSDLYSKSSTPDLSFSSEEARTQWQLQLDLVYKNNKTELDNGKPGKDNSAATGAIEELDEEAYEFRLFSTKPGKPQASRDQPSKVRIWSPEPVTREPGFVHPRRPEVYNFSGPGEIARSQYEAAAIEGEDILKEARVKWVRELHYYLVVMFTALLTTIFPAGLRITMASHDSDY